MNKIILSLIFMFGLSANASTVIEVSLPLENYIIQDIVFHSIHDAMGHEMTDDSISWDISGIDNASSTIVEIHKNEKGETEAIKVESYVFFEISGDEGYIIGDSIDTTCVSFLLKDEDGKYKRNLTETKCDYTVRDYLYAIEYW